MKKTIILTFTTALMLTSFASFACKPGVSKDARATQTKSAKSVVLKKEVVPAINSIVVPRK